MLGVCALLPAVPLLAVKAPGNMDNGQTYVDCVHYSWTTVGPSRTTGMDVNFEMKEYQ